MKSKDQSSLEIIYEQIVKEDGRLLEKEKEYARLTAEQIVEEATKAIKRRIANRGKIRGERLSDFISPLLTSGGERAFGNEVPEHVLSVYVSLLRLDVFMELVYLTTNKLADFAFSGPVTKEEDIVVVVVDPTMLVQTSGKAEKKLISFLDKQALREEIQRVIEQTFIIRYNQCFNPAAVKYTSPNKQVWADWRSDQVKYQEIKARLPELKGIF
jgi:hypothetical protein